jgi:hypothetical protein
LESTLIQKWLQQAHGHRKNTRRVDDVDLTDRLGESIHTVKEILFRFFFPYEARKRIAVYHKSTKRHKSAESGNKEDPNKKNATNLCSSEAEMVEMRVVIFVKCPVARASKSSQRIVPGEKPLASQTLTGVKFKQ